MESTTRLARMRAEVAAGLGATPRTLPPTYFYDERGSGLFEEITRLPEYYPTRAERALLEEQAAPWLAASGARSLVELGAGSAEKTRVLLDALVSSGPGTVYAPLDVSAEFLAGTARRLDRAYDELEIRPIVADLTQGVPVDADLPRPMVVAFLGSTIGNFEHDEAVALLRAATRGFRPGDRLLLGADLKKEPARLNAAYNDAAGVTAEFNLNVLRVLNRELGADFDVDAFRHHAFYDEALGRIEMHLVAQRDTTARIPQVGEYPFAEGDTIRTEISRKYDRAEIRSTLAEAGLVLDQWFESPEGYALVVGRSA